VFGRYGTYIAATVRARARNSHLIAAREYRKRHTLVAGAFFASGSWRILYSTDQLFKCDSVQRPGRRPRWCDTSVHLVFKGDFIALCML
jgi:hypothetical protein